jgi:transposase-like protein
MLCPICSNLALPVGRTRNSIRRWHCFACNRTFTAQGRRKERARVALARTAAASYLKRIRPN